MKIGCKHTGTEKRRPREDGGRRLSDAATSQETTRRKDMENSSLEPPGGTQYCQHLDFKLLGSGIVRTTEWKCVVATMKTNTIPMLPGPTATISILQEHIGLIVQPLP